MTVKNTDKKKKKKHARVVLPVKLGRRARKAVKRSGLKQVAKAFGFKLKLR